MIAEKLRMIKAKSNEPSPIVSNTNINTVTANVTTNNVSNQTVTLNPQEISQISTRLQQIRPQIPQIDKLLLLHSKLANPPLNTLDLTKKLTDCRNILVNQIEISSGNGRKTFVMNLSQLNLLIEQVQRLFNSLVSKMKESAGVSTTTTATTTAITTTPVVTVTPGNTTLSSTKISNQNSSSALSSTSSSHNSSNSSISSSSKQQKLKTVVQNNTNNFEKLLLQRLSLPPDITSNSNTADTWIKRFITYNSIRKPAVRIANQNHLKQRNRLLNHELKSLKQKYHVQDCGLGILNVLISTETHRFIFQISQKYPYEQLIYRIESKKQSKNTFLLPKNREPKTFPFTITSILRNFKE